MKQLLYALVLSSIAAPVVAQPAGCPEKPAKEKAQKKLAGEWFEKGELLVEEEQYAAAVEAFECSLSIVEHPATLYNAAQAATLGGQQELALELLQRWIKVSPYDEMTDEVLAQIGRLEKLIAPEESPEESPPAEEVPTYDEIPPEEPQPPDGKGIATAGWVTFGVGAAAAIAGAVFQGLAAKYESDAESTSKADAWEDFSAKTKTFQTTAIICFAVGGAALGAGVTMIVLGGDDDGDTPAAEVALVPAPGGLVLQGSF